MPVIFSVLGIIAAFSIIGVLGALVIKVVLKVSRKTSTAAEVTLGNLSKTKKYEVNLSREMMERDSQNGKKMFALSVPAGTYSLISVITIYDGDKGKQLLNIKDGALNLHHTVLFYQNAPIEIIEIGEDDFSSEPDDQDEPD